MTPDLIKIGKQIDIGDRKAIDPQSIIGYSKL